MKKILYFLNGPVSNDDDKIAIALLAWSSYTGRDVVQSIEIPKSFEFTF